MRNVQNAKKKMTEGEKYLISCSKKVRTEGEEKDIRLIGNVFYDLQDELSKSAQGIIITTAPNANYKEISTYLNALPTGRGSVLLNVQTAKGTVEIDTGIKLSFDADNVQYLRTLQEVVEVMEI